MFSFEVDKVGHITYKCVSVESDLWHKRYGHVNQTSLKQITLHNFFDGLSKITSSDKVWSTCQFGKQSKIAFPKIRTWKVTTKLELVHTDIGGPMKTLSLNGNKFNILFIVYLTKIS